ncbi:hypothetical protein AYL99_01592 [Fonsecaea erecta]|uniref:Major facilitator superfamily (MFS) profile domain-containing protein n=1 Tax=Fonsecaea erecta TaxID=1367422 RepID=A0A179A0E2_9EURO|nr:hypothetical protein AYL99_01592 [Fonsecaea erecta]OAP65620.1 hypothetical protein AYL99_01592 [Fonsecaea erecta]
MKESRSWLNVAIVLFVCLGSISYGYSASIIATTLGQPQFLSYMNLLPSNPQANALIGATNGLFQTGGLFGSLSIGPFADKFSRRGSIAIAAGTLVFGGALQAASQNVGMYLAFRFITGFGVGLIVGSVPLYQSEVSPPHSRGLLVGLHGVLLALGYSLAGWIGYACYAMKGNMQWRLPLGIQCVPPGLLLLGIYTLPESPRWLVQHGKLEQARAVLHRIHHDAADPEGAFAEKEFYDIKAQCELENTTGAGTWKSLFTGKHNLKRLALGFGTMFGQQCTGTIVINNYGVTLYSNVGFSGRQALALTAGWVTVAIPCNMITSLFIDRLGRVRFLLIGFIGVVCVLIGECVTLAVLEHRSSFSLSCLAIFFLFGHIFFCATCNDATTYIYSSEIFPTHLRAKGLSVSLAGLFLASLTYTQAASSAFAAIGWRYYLLFLCLSAVMVVIIYFFFPETKGLSLEEMSRVFGDPVAVDETSSVGAAAEIKESVEMKA